MYVDGLYDRNRDLIKVAERLPDGTRRLVEYPAPYVFYSEHPAGQHKTIFGQSCKKFTASDSRKFHGKLKRLREEGKRIFESDINPIFRCLHERYAGADTPTLNIGFFDIEVDFDPNRGFAPPDNPFNAVTAISIHLNHLDTMVTLALKPQTYALDDAAAICAQFDNTILFENEGEMLLAYLDLIEDVDVLSGWNCISKTEGVWLSDRILPLGAVLPGQATMDHGGVLRWHDSGVKRANRITLDNGMELLASDEHRIPVMSKKPAAYKYPSSLAATKEDRTVAEIRDMLGDGLDVYMEVRLRQNDNPVLTYRDFLTENLSRLFEYPHFDMVVSDSGLRKKVAETLQANGTYSDVFAYSRKFSSHAEYPRAWASRNFPFISHADLVEQARTAESATFVFDGNNPFVVSLDEAIPADVLQLLGMQFTDGTFDRQVKSLRLYNSDTTLLAHYRETIFSRCGVIAGAVKPIRVGKDGCCAMNYRRGSVLGFLLPMIYDPGFGKRLDVSLLSRLSSDQFAAFYSGMLDGDGCVSNGMVQMANFDGCTAAMQELLAWNGVYASRTENVVVVHPTTVNRSFIERLTPASPHKRSRIATLQFSAIRNAPNAKLRRFIMEDRAYVRLRSIEDSGLDVEMADIETAAHYFHCRGVLVHNSEGFDIPYLTNRIKHILPKGSENALCLWDEKPREREYIQFKKKRWTYDLVGRVHLDYLLLYKKHNTQQQHSYRLDYIGEIETGENKVPYEGTLDDLYKKDFSKFIAYNRQDTMLLVKIDQKRKFIELANQIAHANCVLLKTTMGSVALVETAIINEMHAMGFVVPDRKPRPDATAPEEVEEVPQFDDEDEEPEWTPPKRGAPVVEEKVPVVGAYVAKPKTGLHQFIGAVDINSLYPSAIRALNMSPETIVGQLRPIETMVLVEQRIAAGTPRAEAWEGVFATLEYDHMMAADEAEVTVDFEDGRTQVMTGRELNDYIFNPANHVCITANGTIFRTDKEGMIPALLAKWYSERKQLQAQQKMFGALAKGLEIDAELAALLAG